jgi:hypothetical protein
MCIFGGAAQTGMSSKAHYKHRQLDGEIWHLAQENRQLAQAILDYYTLHQDYEAVREQRRERE